MRRLCEACTTYESTKLTEATFRLAPEFLDQYRGKKPKFGFNGLGEVTWMRTFSRIKPDGTNEEPWETIQRVVEGTYRMQERHIKSQDLGWSDARAQKSAQEMYVRMFELKFLPPGRGIWAMGSPLTEELGLFAALNNCGFTSTANIDKELDEPFTWLMEASMLGIGVGFDTRGAGKVKVQGTSITETYVVTDDREGWIESVRKLIRGYLETGIFWKFDCSGVRKAGLPIKGFGGVTSGPKPLIELHKALHKLFSSKVGEFLSASDIVDIMNLIGVCVVSGNVRRTAEIAFGEPDNEEYLNLKNYHWDSEKKKFVGPSAHRANYGWTSNNSIFATVGMDYHSAAERTRVNGEPGYFWLENAKAYGRMGDLPNNKDKRATGGNPCLEQTLEDKELCCLVETFPEHHDSLEDFQRTLKFAYLYAKTVTLGKTHWPKTNRVMQRNRRIGTSMSGLAQFRAKHRSPETWREWYEGGYQIIQHYDHIYSEWLGVPMSIKTTSIKPSGTVSLPAGATPGDHEPESRFIIRRIQIQANNALIPRIKAANYHVEPYTHDADTMVAEFPIDFGPDVRTIGDMSIWEQFASAAFLQRYWADNQVSKTVTFDPETEGAEVEKCLNYFQYQLKGIALLPRTAGGAHPQMPLEAITEERYKEIVSKLKPLNLKGLVIAAEPEKGCDGDFCALPEAS